MPEGVDRERHGFVFQLVIGEKLLGGQLDRLPALFAILFFQDLTVALLQPLPLPTLLGNRLLLVGGAGRAAVPPTVLDDLVMVELPVPKDAHMPGVGPLDHTIPHFGRRHSQVEDFRGRPAPRRS